MKNERVHHSSEYDEHDKGEHGRPGVSLEAHEDTVKVCLDYRGAKLTFAVTGWPPGDHHPTEAVIVYTGWPPGRPVRYVIPLATGWPPGGPKEVVAKPADDESEDEAPDREE